MLIQKEGNGDRERERDRERESVRYDSFRCLT